MYDQRDIVLIPIPFSDLSSRKRRPVIVISNDEYNHDNLDIVVAALTSNLSYENNYCVEIDQNNIEGGKLPKKSKIRCDKIYTVSKSIVLRKYDKVKADTFKTVQQKIKLLIEMESLKFGAIPCAS